MVWETLLFWMGKDKGSSHLKDKVNRLFRLQKRLPLHMLHSIYCVNMPEIVKV